MSGCSNMVGSDGGVLTDVAVDSLGRLITVPAGAGGTQDVDIVAQTLSPLVVSHQTSAVGTFSSIAVGAASILALPANAARVGASIVNNGNVDMYLGFAPVALGSTPSATGGSLIRRNGGAWDPKGYTGSVYLISSGAGTVAGIQEW